MSSAGSAAPPAPPLSSAQSAALALDGFRPRYALAPESVEAMASALAWAAGDRLAVLPRGGGTRVGLGNVPRAYDVALSTARLNEIVEYEPADLTITLEAGVPFATMQAALRERRQFLPLDPPLADGSTIGGVVATNASGPFRLRYGSARDMVIGTTVANSSGTVTKSGGKVVKNVTGYDLNKLYVGSLGTLGVISRLTFKVQPLPEVEHTLAATFPDAATACRAVYSVLRTALTPSALEVLTPSAAASVGLPSQYTLVAHIGGFRAPAERAVRDITAFARETGASGVEPLDGAAADALWARLRNASGSSAHDPAARGGLELTYVKIAVPVAETAWAIDAVDAAAAANGLDSHTISSAGIGVVRGALRGDGLDTDARLLAALRRLRAQVREHLGSLVVVSAPLVVKREIDVFGEPGDGFTIMQRLKHRLDPAGVLNPGRFLGRL